MMNYKTKWLLALALLMTGTLLPVSTPASAQSTSGPQKIVERSDGRYETLEEHFMMHFHWDKTNFDPGYLTNGSELERLRSFVDGLDWNLNNILKSKTSVAKIYKQFLSDMRTSRIIDA